MLVELLAAGLVLTGLSLAQTPPTARNLLPNPSFEEVDAGLPEGWRWWSGKAKAQLSVDHTVARSGKKSLRIVNPTAQAPHVCGRLATSVRLTPGGTYTLSCYVKSSQPGRAWIGSGSKWQHRFAFPAGNDWTRVVGTFEADALLQDINIISESPTNGLWIDDVKLEPGPTASPYVYQEPLAPGQTELLVYQGQWISVAPNLVDNASFERLTGGMPEGWAFSKRNTDATMTVDETVAHTGRRSLKFTNGTRFGAHVYGTLVYRDGMRVKPNCQYTLSCYVRSDNPGIAWIGGGPKWHLRRRFPKTGDAWKRVSITFRTEQDVESYPLLVLTESPTEGFWIDDVKLEEGGEATLFVPEETGKTTQLFLDVPADVVCGTSLALSTWLSLPRKLDQATLTASLRSPGGQSLAEATWQGGLTAGAAYAELRWGVPGDAPDECMLSVSVASTGKAIATGETRFRLRSATRGRHRLAQMRERVKTTRGLLENARRKGHDGAYPLVGVTVADNFCDFVESDLEHLEVLRAEEQLDQIGQILDRAQTELQALIDGKQAELAVPRYVTSPIEIDGTSFVASVQWPDGRRERRPVFFCGYGHFGSVKRDIEKFPDYGLNMIQVEFGPRSTVPSETQVSTKAIEAFAELLQRAAASNVAVNLLLSPHYFPQWAYDKWPSIGGVDGGFIKFSVDAPQTRGVIQRHLELTAARLKGKPALHSYCLSNEPIYRDPSKDPHNATRWAAWLRQRYQSLDALNGAHRASYESFTSVPVPVDAQDPATPLSHDWCRFNNERFADWHRWMADVIHKQDPQMPVHAKTMNTLFWHRQMKLGVDPELFCDLSQIAGNDSWKMVDHQEGDWASRWQPQNMHFDLQRSCRGQPIFNSENHVITDRDLAYVPGAHIRNILWQAAIHGEGASTMWVWERTFDNDSSFAGSIMHRPVCAEAHGRVALDLMRLAPEITALQQAPARLAIVYSISSLIYGRVESERQLHRVYQALNFLGEKIDFITERQLAGGKGWAVPDHLCAGYHPPSGGRFARPLQVPGASSPLPVTIACHVTSSIAP